MEAVDGRPILRMERDVRAALRFLGIRMEPQHRDVLLSARVLHMLHRGSSRHSRAARASPHRNGRWRRDLSLGVRCGRTWSASLSRNRHAQDLTTLHRADSLEKIDFGHVVNPFVGSCVVVAGTGTLLSENAFVTRDAVIAVNRFGLGARPDELSTAAADPRGWLREHSSWHSRACRAKSARCPPRPMRSRVRGRARGPSRRRGRSPSAARSRRKS